MSDARSQQQAVYEALIGTADKTKNVTVEILTRIQEMLAEVLKHAYSDNNELKDKLQKTSLLAPELAEQLGGNLSPIVENMQKIHNKVSAMNNEMQAMQAKVAFLNEQGKNVPSTLQHAIADELSKELTHLNEENQTYTKGLAALRQSVMLGQQELAKAITPQDIKAFDNTLTTIYGEAKKLKEQATNKKEVVEKVEETTQKRLGK